MMTTTYRGYRVCSDTCPTHSVEHYSGGDTVVRDDLRAGRQLLWRAWRSDGTALHATSTAWMSEGATCRAIDADAKES